MSVRPSYDRGPPCSSRAVDATLRMAMAGFSWGLFMGSYDANKKGHMGFPKFIYVAKAIGGTSVKWGFFGGLYVGLSCGFEVWRLRRDWKNAALAGGLTGAVAGSLKPGVKRMLTTAAGAALVCSTLEYLKPVEYPPTITK